MSNRISKIKEEVENYERELEYNCNHCTIGSVMLTLGKLAGKSDKEIYKDFSNILEKLPRQDEWSIYTLCNFFIDSYYHISDEQKSHLVLCYDKENVMSPLVTIITNDLLCDDDEPKLWPIASDGSLTGILAKPERLQYEKIYD